MKKLLLGTAIALLTSVSAYAGDIGVSMANSDTFLTVLRKGIEKAAADNNQPVQIEIADDDVQKQLKKANDLARKHGAENVTALVTMVGGEGTNTIGVLSTAEDWSRYGQIQDAMMKDPDMQALLVEASQMATWQTYVSQTIPDL